MSDQEFSYEKPESHSSNTSKDSGFLGKVVLGLIAVLFIPAVILGCLIYFVIFRKFRQKPSVIFAISSSLILISLLVWKFSDAWTKIISVVENWKYISVYWTELIPAWSAANILLGAVAGFIFVFGTVRTMKSNPHLMVLEGSWMYGFKFRRTPLEAYRRKRKIQGLKDGAYQSPDRIPLGINEDDEIVYRYNTEMHQSTIISGTTGSGKTITLLNSMLSDIVNGISIVVIDFKRSQEFSTKLAQWSAEYGRDFYHFDNGTEEDYDIEGSPGHAYYDPLKNAGTAKGDMILGMRGYDAASEVYKGYMRGFLQALFPIIDHAKKEKTKNIKWNEGEIYKLNSIVNGLNGSAHGNLLELIDATEGTPAEALASDLETKVKSKTSGMNHGFTALQGQISTLVNSAYGRWLKYEEGGRNIDMYELLKSKGNVILFSMDALSEKDFSKYMGSLILSDLSAVSAMRLRNDVTDHVNVYIDEFQAVSPASLAPLLEKSRGAGFGTTMASQSYEQIIAAADSNGEAMLNGILDTSASFIVHAGATERSAKRLSDIAGQEKKTVYRKTNQNESTWFSFNWFNKRNQNLQTSSETDWIAPPKTFMNLAMPKKSNNFKTEAVIVKKSSDDPRDQDKEGVVIKKVLMIPNSKVLEKYVSHSDERQEVSPEEMAQREQEQLLAKKTQELMEEQNLAIPEPPLNYIDKDVDKNQEYDELDFVNVDDEDLTEEEQEIRDGGFVIEEILGDETEPEEEDDLLQNINLDEIQKFQTRNKQRPEPTDKNTVYTANSGQKTSGGLPTVQPVNSDTQKPVAKSATHHSQGQTSTFGAMVGTEDFKPAKRRKERPPIVDDDEELDDALPDFDF